MILVPKKAKLKGAPGSPGRGVPVKSTPLCWVGVGEDESGPNLISKAREGAPRGQTRWEVGTDGDFQAGVRDEERLCQVLEGARTLLGARPGVSRVRPLEEIGLQSGSGLPVKRGQNPREGPGPGLCWLPGLKQLCCARARPSAPTARHTGPQWALERLRPRARTRPGTQGGGQRAGAQAGAGQTRRGRRWQRCSAVGRWAARGLLGVVVLGRAARLALFGARRARRTLGAGCALLFAELGPAVLEPDLRAQVPVSPGPQAPVRPRSGRGRIKMITSLPIAAPRPSTTQLVALLFTPPPLAPSSRSLEPSPWDLLTRRSCWRGLRHRSHHPWPWPPISSYKKF